MKHLATLAPEWNATAIKDDAGAMAARLNHAIDLALAERRIVGGVVLVARSGRLAYTRAAGHADRESGTPMALDTPFRLASITKPIVTIAALRLVEAGTLSLTDPVTKWLPFFTPRLQDGSVPQITLHQLLTHTAGLDYGFQQPPGGPYERLGVSDGLDHVGFDLDENLRRLAAAPLVRAPGSGWGYSLALDVLGAVIARATRMSLPHAIGTLVTAPLGLSDLGFSVGPDVALAAPYANAEPEPLRMPESLALPLPAPLGGHEVRFSPGRAFDAHAYPSGGAAMTGSAPPLLRLFETIRQGGAALLSPQTTAAMMTAHVGADAQTRGPGWGFGYGGAVLVDPAAAGSPQAPGTLQWGGAYGHTWFVDRVNAITVVSLTNTAYEGMCGRFTIDVRDAVYG